MLAFNFCEQKEGRKEGRKEAFKDEVIWGSSIVCMVEMGIDVQKKRRKDHAVTFASYNKIAKNKFNQAT